VSERGDVADWLGTGLQSPLIGFDSRRRLKQLLILTAIWYGFGTSPRFGDEEVLFSRGKQESPNQQLSQSNFLWRVVPWLFSASRSSLFQGRVALGQCHLLRGDRSQY
jgi:hypothetical protein